MPTNQGMLLASEIISEASRQAPADYLLRVRLRDARGLRKSESSFVAKAVFAYFRWKMWLSEKCSTIERLQGALDMQARFDAGLQTFPTQELILNAVPKWVPELVYDLPRWIANVQMEPTLWLRARSRTAQRLASEIGGVLTQVPDAVIYMGEEDLFKLKSFQDGRFELQDVASQLVSIACNPRPGQKWWDVCAGEGGKTLHLSDLMANTGQVWATDKSSYRIARLRRRAARARIFNYRAAAADITTSHVPEKHFDGVLVDAPCSGIGTWQRNPHARWTTLPGDVNELALIQSQLLNAAAKAVKPGGMLVYSVCTLINSETHAVADEFESKHEEFFAEPMMEFWRPNQGPWPRLMITPDLLRSNGMFIARWRRAK